VGRCGLESYGSEWGTMVGSCEHGNEVLCFKKKTGNSLTTWVTISFSRRTMLYCLRLQVSKFASQNEHLFMSVILSGFPAQFEMK
jgi:hypothetical protein